MEELQQALAAANEAKFIANNIWMMVATVLVFIMHLGFATLESGFVQKKNECARNVSCLQYRYENIFLLLVPDTAYYLDSS